MAKHMTAKKKSSKFWTRKGWLNEVHPTLFNKKKNAEVFVDKKNIVRVEIKEVSNG